MFTAVNWRNFPRLRLVLPIRPMTSFLQIFTFLECPILHYFWEVLLVPLFPLFFLSCGSPIYFSNFLVDCSKLLLCLPSGSFIMIHVTYCSLFQNSDHVPR